MTDERPRAAVQTHELMLALVRGPALAVVTLPLSILLFVLSVVSLALLPIGVGVVTFPPVQRALRRYANQRRRLVHRWGGIEVPEPYRPWPRERGGGVVGWVEQCVWLLKDPATWRDISWLPADMTAGFTTALLPPMLPLNHQLTARMLEPTREMLLSRRVAELYETRHDAVDSSAAELRRIERDLHDGAQARLVAMGMSLGTIEALVERDPAKAKALIAQARENSAEALTELRDLVRGIHPPVLAERGLPDALRALALRMQIPVEADIDLPGRFDEPVETAVYFAVSEVLTNAAKHAEPSRVWLDVLYAEDTPDAGAVRVTVTDDGKGGASLDAGSGLRGVQRRLAQFDGVLALDSPADGPTMVTLEVPAQPT
ncbi:sensor histidine kinase [Streptomyces reniochalinae]|uniref:histidine kinase n=1 Tax=Streptomyces reniochalinae TaxID=2250578 RepID=A0A367ECU0_9ACTN|nr:histidine kinase [Streptomyces reniochalinae]RCG15050.1 sensor histidine kinase [Streptomyces reniochalinae]